MPVIDAPRTAPAPSSVESARSSGAVTCAETSGAGCPIHSTTTPTRGSDSSGSTSAGAVRRAASPPSARRSAIPITVRGWRPLQATTRAITASPHRRAAGGPEAALGVEEECAAHHHRSFSSTPGQNHDQPSGACPSRTAAAERAPPRTDTSTENGPSGVGSTAEDGRSSAGRGRSASTSHPAVPTESAEPGTGSNSTRHVTSSCRTAAAVVRRSGTGAGGQRQGETRRARPTPAPGPPPRGPGPGPAVRRPPTPARSDAR